jgi:hypothetical protein
MTLSFIVSKPTTETKEESTYHPCTVFEHIIPRVSNRRLTIDGGGIRIRSHRRAPLDALETPVIALGGGKDGAQGVAQGIERNDVRGGDSRHGRCCEEGKRGNGYW